jgi:hypothetical protein
MKQFLPIYEYYTFLHEAISSYLWVFLHVHYTSCIWGPFLTSPLGMNLAPRGEICPLGDMFTPSFTPCQGWTLLRRMEGWISPPWDNFTPEGTKFTPGGQLRPWVKVNNGAQLEPQLFDQKNFLSNSFLFALSTKNFRRELSTKSCLKQFYCFSSPCVLLLLNISHFRNGINRHLTWRTDHWTKRILCV